MRDLSIFKARSFYATAAAILTGLEQSIDISAATDIPGLLSAVAVILGFIGIDGEAFITVAGPIITAVLGLWAYIERLNGTRHLVLWNDDNDL